MTEIELRRYRKLDQPARQTLIDLYADVRAPLLHLPNYAVATFAERLDRHASEPGFEVVVAYDQDQPAGYAYGNTIEGGDRWWTRMAKPLPAEITATPALALKEIGVRIPWRGTGLARRIHDCLVAGRTEKHVTLMVNLLPVTARCWPCTSRGGTRRSTRYGRHQKRRP